MPENLSGTFTIKMKLNTDPFPCTVEETKFTIAKTTVPVDEKDYVKQPTVK